MQRSFHTMSARPWLHDHAFGLHLLDPSEQKMAIVTVLTAATMCLEVVAGCWTGSLALLAHGLSMASHAAALGIAAMACRFARRHAQDRSFSFGTGKVNALAAFTGGVLLMSLAAGLGIQGAIRLMAPAAANYDQAIKVAVIGLLLNALSVCILGGAAKARQPGRETLPDHHLKGAYLHVITDTATAAAAVAALLSARYLALGWIDPIAGLVGAALITRWSWGFLKATAGVLLDHQAPKDITDEIVKRLEDDGTAEIADLHVWSIGPSIHSAAVTLLSEHPRSVQYYKELVTKDLPIVHSTVEIFQLSSRRRNLRLIRPPIESLPFGSSTPAFVTP